MKSFAILCLVAAAFASPVEQASNVSGNITAASNTTTTASCSKTQLELENGIKQNLNIQAQELKGVEFLQSMVQGGNASAKAFKDSKKAVLAIQEEGVSIRANNQKLAQQIKSPAADGLATVAMAQGLEISQVKSLNGTTADSSTLKMLVTEVQGGTKQNEKNLAAAKSQKCPK